MKVKHLALLYPIHVWATRDVAVGYEKAFNRLGLHVTDIHSEELWVKWCDIEDLVVGEVKNENKRKILERTTADVVFEVLRCAPDLVVVIDGLNIHDIFWDWMDRLDIPIATVLTDSPYLDVGCAYVAERSTFTFSNDLWSAQKIGIPYLPLAYCQEIHHPFIVSEKYQSDVCFAGSGFPERKAFLEQVDWDDINFRLLGYWDLEDNSPLKPYFKQDTRAVPNPEVASYYNGAKLVLNLDRVSVDFQGKDKINGRGSVGPRIYEAAACGAAIISQRTVPELDTLLGNCYIPFETPDQLSEQLRIWLADDMAEARRDIGRGARQTIQGHSYTDRALQLLETI